jgi:hypothetical protein
MKRNHAGTYGTPSGHHQTLTLLVRQDVSRENAAVESRAGFDLLSSSVV